MLLKSISSVIVFPPLPSLHHLDAHGMLLPGAPQAEEAARVLSASDQIICLLTNRTRLGFLLSAATCQLELASWSTNYTCYY
jgi:hypothetical protein